MTKKINLFLFSLLIIIGATVVTVARTSDNISGTAWSTNIGWISLNNCTDPTNSATCDTGSDYGLSAPYKTSGTSTISGYTWSSNIGWVKFNDGTCPTTPCSSATINWTTGKIIGWARACSVYASGCSGALADDAYRGVWDGYIALNPKDASGTAVGGLSIDKTTGEISGYAWGSDVVGWITFNGTIQIPALCPDGTTVVPDAPGTCSCPTDTTYDRATNSCIQDIICTGGVVIGQWCNCPVGTVLDNTQKICNPIQCPSGTVLQGYDCVPTTPNEPVVCGVRQIVDPSDPTGNTCICTNGKPIPTNGICPKKSPIYIES